MNADFTSFWFTVPLGDFTAYVLIIANGKVQFSFAMFLIVFIANLFLDPVEQPKKDGDVSV